jgi:hypothetical protein
VIGRQLARLQQCYLQALTEIAAEKDGTIVFPLPLDLLERFLSRPAVRAIEAGSPVNRYMGNMLAAAAAAPAVLPAAEPTAPVAN